jgi:hypothetical protein
LSAPVATSLIATEIEWTWALANPDSWNVYISTDGGITYVLSDNVGGATRSDNGFSSGVLAYVQGIDSIGNPVTAPSNVVTIM